MVLLLAVLSLIKAVYNYYYSILLVMDLGGSCCIVRGRYMWLPRSRYGS